jgi:hypothetical protein
MSLLLHVAAVAAFLFAGARLGCERRLLGTAAAIFAVHATHAEAVGGSVSHADLASAVFGLCALGLAARPDTRARPLGIAGLVLIAALFKESALVFAAAAIAVVLCERSALRVRLLALLPVALVCAAVLGVQLMIERPIDPRYNLSLVYDARGLQRLALGLAFFARGSVISFVPIGLAPKHSYAAWDLSAETLLPHAIPGALLLLLAAVALAAAAARRHALALALLIVLIGPILINTGFIVQVPNEMPERTFYPATMAASGLIAALLRRIANPKLERALLALLLLAMFGQRYRAQRPWHDELSLWTYALSVEPKSAELQMFMAHAQEEAGRPDQALFHAVVTAYVATQRPARVDWERVERLQVLPVAERWQRAPQVLWPIDPCRFALGMLIALRSELPSLQARAEAAYRQHYAQCFAALPARSLVQ